MNALDSCNCYQHIPCNPDLKGPTRRSGTLTELDEPEAHGPHRSPGKTVPIDKYIFAKP